MRWPRSWRSRRSVTPWRDVDALPRPELPMVVQRRCAASIELGSRYRTRLTALAAMKPKLRYRPAVFGAPDQRPGERLASRCGESGAPQTAQRSDWALAPRIGSAGSASRCRPRSTTTRRCSALAAAVRAFVLGRRTSPVSRKRRMRCPVRAGYDRQVADRRCGLDSPMLRSACGDRGDRPFVGCAPREHANDGVATSSLNAPSRAVFCLTAHERSIKPLPSEAATRCGSAALLRS